jgi:hypothetical protein
MVHVYPAPAATHCKADTPTSVTTALAPPIVTDEPVGDAAVAVGIATEKLAAAGELKETVPITPLPMMLEFNPLAIQVIAVEFCAQLIDLPAAVKAGPAVTLKLVTPAGKANVSSTAAGSFPAAEESISVSEPGVPATAVAVERASDDWALIGWTK